MFTADEMREKPVRITGKGEIFIGEEQILAGYPIESDSISVTRWHGRLNKLTLTLLVGPASVELRSDTTKSRNITINNVDGASATAAVRVAEE